MIWWKKLLLVFGLFVLWFCGLIFVDGLGYPSQYFWVTGSMGAICFGVAPFWRLRTSIWYWPTVVLLIVANLATLYVEWTFISHPDLPSKGIVQTLFLLDCIASWGFMVGVCWLISRKFPWQFTDQ